MQNPHGLEPKIIFEYTDLLVLDKPAGMVVDKSETQVEGTVEEWLEKRLQVTGGRGQLARAGIVHRLDKDTSGLLLVAKTQAALENLQSQFKERTTKKEYLALVHGIIEKAGVIEGGIGRNPGNREKFVVIEEGKEAVTEYEPLERLAFRVERIVEIFSDFSKIKLRKLDAIRYYNYTLVKAKPHTGRTHQIRVHLKYIGFPIVADEKYAGRKTYRLDKRWCPRQFLHAAKIGFKHPVSGEWMEFESPLPEDLEEALTNLKTQMS
jgi:23S rRNA pseudouridine1911/1915/1917 synthase